MNGNVHVRNSIGFIHYFFVSKVGQAIAAWPATFIKNKKINFFKLGRFSPYISIAQNNLWTLCNSRKIVLIQCNFWNSLILVKKHKEKSSVWVIYLPLTFILWVLPTCMLILLSYTKYLKFYDVVQAHCYTIFYLYIDVIVGPPQYNERLGTAKWSL